MKPTRGLAAPCLLAPCLLALCAGFVFWAAVALRPQERPPLVDSTVGSTVHSTPRRATLAEAQAMRERILAAQAERRRRAWPLLEKVGR